MVINKEKSAGRIMGARFSGYIQNSEKEGMKWRI